MTDECPVPRCGQPRPKHAFICNDCRRVLKQDLASVPALVEDLLVTISRQDVLGATGGRRAAETAVPWKAHASEVLYDLTTTVTLWTKLMLEHYQLSSEVIFRAYDGLEVPHRITISAARWLWSNVNSLAMNEAAGDAVDEIAVAVGRAYSAIDRPAEKLAAGQCLVDGCEAYMYAEPTAKTVDCPKCGSTHDMAELRAWMSEAASERRVTATEALSWVRLLLGKPMPDGTWRRWLAEGRLHHDDNNHLGHKLYRWGDVVEEVRAWIARPRKVKEEAA